MTASQSTRRRFTLAIVTVALAMAASLVALEIVLQFLPVSTVRASIPVNQEQPTFRFEPNQPFLFSRGWNFSLVNRGRINNDGFVSDQDYDPAATSPLLALIGDSFVEALMVPYAETVQGRLQRTLGDAGRAYSFAASGAPLSQYLAWADYARQKYRADAMVFVVIANDFDESHASVAFSRGYHYFTQGQDGGLRLVLNPSEPGALRAVAERSALLRYVLLNLGVQAIRERWRAKSDRRKYVGNVAAAAPVERVEMSRRVVDAFFAALPARSGLPPDRILFVLDGIRPQLYDPAGLEQVANSYFAIMRRHFTEAATSRGYAVIDMQPIFIDRHRADGARFEFGNDAHWNGLAHELAAEAIIESSPFQDLFPAQR